MKILHISTPMSWRGGEQQLAYLATELRKLDVEQVFACTQGSAMETFCYDNELICFPMGRGILSLPNNAGLIRRICKNYQVDIIHTHDSKGHTYAYVSALMGNKTPIVVSRRVDFPVGRNWLSRKKYNHPQVKKILCVSEKIKAITGASIQNKSVLEVVYSGVDTDLSHETPADLHKEFNIPDDYAIVGNIAALAPHKDYFTFINTAEILLKEGRKIKFLIIGDGPLKMEIQDYIGRKKLKKDVIMTGFREDAKAMMAALDLMLVTSETEGLGTSILDAFVRKVPVAATAAGGIVETVRHGHSGMLAPVKNAKALAMNVHSILSNRSLRERLTDNAREMVKYFDKKIMAEQTLHQYKQVLKD